MEKKDKELGFANRFGFVFKADARRAFTSLFFYVMLGIAFAVPILILVMTTANSSSAAASIGFESVWQIIGTLESSARNAQNAAVGMDMTAMCNVNLLFFAVAVFVCVFVGDDFKSGYAKNVFSAHSKKFEYVASKILTCFVASFAFFVAFFVGALIGGGVAGLSFETAGFSVWNVVCCLISKVLLSAVFVSLFVVSSVVAKKKTWLSVCLALAFSTILYSLVPVLTPINSSLINVAISLIAGVGSFVGLGAASTLVLNKTDLV